MAHFCWKQGRRGRKKSPRRDHLDNSEGWERWRQQQAHGLKEIYHPSGAPESWQQPQISLFNWAGLADQCSFCQPAALEESSERKEGRETRRREEGRSRRCCLAADELSLQKPLATLLNCSSYRNARKWIPQLFCLNPMPVEKNRMCLKSSYPLVLTRHGTYLHKRCCR